MILKYKSRGEDVIKFQEKMKNAGINCGKIDGVYGRNTRNACITFQEATGLETDGICGEKTWDELQKPKSSIITPIKVCSWNIKRGFGNIGHQKEYLLSIAPQIVGLQEVYCKGSINNLTSLKNPNLSYSVFAPTIGGYYGSGVLSQLKLGKVTIFKLYSGGYEKRLLMRTRTFVNGKVVSIYVTHFTYESSKVRKRQFAQVKAIMAADNAQYRILLGDFNTTNFSDMTEDYNVLFENSIDQIIITRNITFSNSKILPTLSLKLTDHNMVCTELGIK